ncbi:MAG TPA: Rieske (2Fe-2S) protein [Nitrososphaerales archaeon]|nr:Rieske (2Fe-2S) protein [Nitrososphaerales archaeon]
MNRREFVRRAAAGGLLLAVAAVGLLELTETIRSEEASRPSGLQSPPTATQRAGAPPGYLYLVPQSTVSNEPFEYFVHPTFGESILINFQNEWRAFSATCTHEPCTVQFPGNKIYCPCHGATFDPTTGAVLSGPPPRPLPEYSVQVLDGSIYVSEQATN